MKQLFLAFLCPLFLVIALPSQTYAENPPKGDNTQVLKNQGKEPPPPTQATDQEFDKKMDAYLAKENIGREKREVDTSYWQEFSRMLFVLGGILVAIILASWLLKKLLKTRLLQANSTNAIKILDKRALHPKAWLYLIEVEGKRIVIGEGQGGLTHLSDLPPSAVKEEETSPKKGFSSFLKKNMQEPLSSLKG